jgi:RsiW-degrading membrane proteinase PrsW (M82 family)
VPTVKAEYILILRASRSLYSHSTEFGIISHIICHARRKKDDFGNVGIVFSVIAIGLLGFEL